MRIRIHLRTFFLLQALHWDQTPLSSGEAAVQSACTRILVYLSWWSSWGGGSGGCSQWWWWIRGWGGARARPPLHGARDLWRVRGRQNILHKTFLFLSSLLKDDSIILDAAKYSAWVSGPELCVRLWLVVWPALLLHMWVSVKQRMKLTF